MQQRISDYNMHASAIAEVFPAAQHVNGDQEATAVFECLDALLVQPLM